MKTIIVAQNPFAGDALYQRRARQAFPLVVRQAKAGETITYTGLAIELGMPNARNLNYVLGSIARGVEDVATAWKRDIPRLTAVVVNQHSGLPGEGLMNIMLGEERLRRATPQDRKRFFGVVLEQVYRYEQWDNVLAHFGLRPVGPLVPPTPDPVRGGPESEAHRLLKEYVAMNPAVLGLPPQDGSRMEAPLNSGDRIDVLFERRGRLVGIEVKSEDATIAEIMRGVFQCVKYAALLSAEQRARQIRVNAEAWLVTGGPFPPQLSALRNTLGVKAIENVCSARGTRARVV